MISSTVAEPPVGGYSSGYNTDSSANFGLGSSGPAGFSSGGIAGFLGSSGLGASSFGVGSDGGNAGNANSQGQVRRFVSVHIAPEEGKMAYWN